MAETAFLVDTNVVLRFLLDEHPIMSSKANGFFNLVSKNKIKAKIPSFIIAEYIYALSKYYNIPKFETVDKLTYILGLPGIVNADRPELLSALLPFKKSTCNFPDCLLVAMSTKSRKVVSFDSDFSKMFVYRETL